MAIAFDAGPTSVPNRQVVIEVGGKGGSIIRSRENSGDGWQSQSKRTKRRNCLTDIHGPNFVPIQISPEYMQQILAAVEK